jgi:hypothetical protein
MANKQTNEQNIKSKPNRLGDVEFLLLYRKYNLVFVFVYKS